MKKTIVLTLLFTSFQVAAADLNGRWFGNGYYKNSVLGSHSAQVFMEFTQTPEKLSTQVCWRFVKEAAIWTVCDRWYFDLIGLEIWWYGSKVGELNKTGFDFQYGESQNVFTLGHIEWREDGRLNFRYEDHDSAGRETRNFVEGMKAVN